MKPKTFIRALSGIFAAVDLNRRQRKHFRARCIELTKQNWDLGMKVEALESKIINQADVITRHLSHIGELKAEVAKLHIIRGPAKHESP